MAGRLIGAWNPALDSAGNPISGAKLYTYSAGTTTNKVTYTDSGLGTPNLNPVVADSAGRFPELWSADGGTYDLKWTDASGTQIELFQSIQALGSAATGAVARDFGADGKFNLESRGGTTYLESGDADPDNTGGKLRLGGWAGTQGDTLVLDYVSITGTSPWGSAVKGTTTSDSASAGIVGEYIFATVAQGSAVALTNNTATNITSISLTAGDWDVGATGWLTPGSGDTATYWEVNISSISTTRVTPPGASAVSASSGSFTATASVSVRAGTTRLSLSALTTIYLVGYATHSGGTAGGYGCIQARRVR